MNLILLEPNDFTAPDRVRLSGRRLQHISKVQRAEVGKQLLVGMRNGKIGRGEIAALGHDALEMRVSLDAEPPPPLQLTLVLALPRPKMLKRVLQSAVSMGVKQIHLINSYRVEKSFWDSPLLSPQKLEEPVVLGRQHSPDENRRNVLVARRRSLFFAELRQQAAVTAVDRQWGLQADVPELFRKRQSRRDIVIPAGKQAREDRQAREPESRQNRRDS